MNEPLFIWDFVADTILGQIVDWIYGQVMGFLGNFFAEMGNMGVELFELSWVQSIVLFFSYLAWALYVTGLVVACFECGIEYSSGRGNLKETALCAIKGFMAVSLFTVVPVRLYELSVTLQASLTAGITGYGTSIGEAATEIVDSLSGIDSLTGMTTGSYFGFASITSPIMLLFCIILMAYAVIKVFFANLKRGGILLIQIAVGSLYKPSDRQNILKETETAQKAVYSFFDCLKVQMQQQINTAQQDMRYAERFFFDGSEESLALLEAMIEAVKSVALSIQVYSSFEYNNRSTAASDELDELSETLAEMIAEVDDYLLWIERKGSQSELVYCPKNTREITNRLYFSGTARTILTSATLTNATEGSLEEQYAYFISNTGFPTDEHGCLSEPKPSPYPYDEHSMIYYCDDLPHPTKEHEAFIEQGVQRLLEVLDISGGKALVLFTAKTDMEEVYSILSQKELPYKVLMQQPGSSQDQVLNEFKEDTNSVLLGTGAYWEGISIEGKSLSNVVIFRLPFPVPDPIIEYKASIAKDPLMDVRVPEMVIKLKQGIGRLIRNFTDTGIVCIIDRRLRDAPAERYHDIAWASLPIKNRTKDLGELRRFYESLPAAHNETEG